MWLLGRLAGRDRAEVLCRVGPPGRCVAGASALPPHFAGSGRSAVRGQAALPPKLLLASPHRRAGPVLQAASALPWGGF